jgi:chitinase
LTVSTDGTCGAEKGTKCASGCCSQYGNCGTSPEHCSGACQHAFGTGCTDADVAGSWQNAAKNGVTDEKAGGQYYFDADNHLFWTWDTPDLISRKFDDIVRKYNLGGVMAWSLGEDSNDWSHIKRMADELAKSPYTPSEPATYKPKPTSKKPSPVPAPAPTYEPSPPAPAISTNDYSSLPGNPSLESDPNLPYDVVWVDGTTDGPTGDYSSSPGSPNDYTVVWADQKGAPEETIAPKPQGQWEAQPAPASVPAPAPAPAPATAPASAQFDDGSWNPTKYDHSSYNRKEVADARVPGTTEQIATYEDSAPGQQQQEEEEEEEEEQPQYDQACHLRRLRRKKRAAMIHS